MVDGQVRHGPLLLAPNEDHLIVAGARDATFIFVDGDVARTRRYDGSLRWAQRAAPETWAAAQEIAEALTLGGPTIPEPSPVRQARLALSDSEDRRRLDDVAADVGLSTSRLSHLFTATVGTPMRSYRRWQRLLVAAERIAEGASMTAAAHASGFADGPHLARTFRRHFGLSISELTTGIRFVFA